MPAVDPEVFVADSSVATGGIGLENIEHIAGLRALRLDDPDLPLFAADGLSLGFTSEKWIHATGTIALSNAGSGVRVGLNLERLVAFGVYGIFKQIAGTSGPVDVPVDGTGATSTFRAGARGEANLTVVSPQGLEPQSDLYVTYHSDGRAHGVDPGIFGINAHRHLAVRI